MCNLADLGQGLKEELGRWGESYVDKTSLRKEPVQYRLSLGVSHTPTLTSFTLLSPLRVPLQAGIMLHSTMYQNGTALLKKHWEEEEG